MPRYIGEVKVVIEAANEDDAMDIFDEVVTDHLDESVAEDGRVLRYYGVDINEDA